MSKKLLILAFIGFYFTYYVIAADASTSNQCYTCRGINCYRTSAQEVIETCIYDLDACVTIFDKFAVKAKGCLLNMPVELRSKCNDKTNPECQVCIGQRCNTLGRKDFQCYECNSRNDTNCESSVSSLSPVQCKIPSAPNSYCFTERTNDGILKRGCSLHVKDQKACLANNDCALCSVEDGKGCNAAKLGLASSGEKKSAAFALVLLCVLTIIR